MVVGACVRTLPWIWGSHGLMVRFGLVTDGFMFESQVQQDLWVGGSEYSALPSTLNTMSEVRPLSKALNPQLLPGCRSIDGCPLLCVCVH